MGDSVPQTSKLHQLLAATLNLQDQRSVITHTETDWAGQTETRPYISANKPGIRSLGAVELVSGLQQLADMTTS